MAGHSAFKNIMHKKGRKDAARAKMFAKFAREITVAAKQGMPDPAMNPRLRLAIATARAENMPKDNIERAIKKAQGGESDADEGDDGNGDDVLLLHDCLHFSSSMSAEGARSAWSGAPMSRSTSTVAL